MFQKILFAGDEQHVYTNGIQVLEKQVGFNKLKQSEQAELLHVTCMRSGPFVGTNFNKTAALHFVRRLRKPTHVADQIK